MERTKYQLIKDKRVTSPQPVDIDSTYAVTSEDSNVATTESFEGFS